MELKPCPFCGGEAYLDFAHGGNLVYANKNGFAASTPLLYMVFCGNCSVRTIPCETPEIATVIWNRRENDV